MKDGLICAVSTKADGNMSLKWGDKNEVIRNKNKFLKKLNIDLDNCVTMSLVHGTKVVKIGKNDKGKFVEADGLITDESGIGLMMVTGDCLPLVVYDSKKKRLGLAHLGWRGVNGKLAQKIINEFLKLGTKLEDIRIWIGPGVRKGSYKKWDKGWDDFVEEIGDNLKEWKEFLEKSDDGKTALDLAGYVEKQLIDAGIKKQKVEMSPVDTVTDKNYFSHHRSYYTGEPEGRFATVVMIK